MSPAAHGIERHARTLRAWHLAILKLNERAAAILRQYLARIDDDRLRGVVAAAVDIGQPTVSPAGSPVEQRNDLWKGLSARGND
jgi:hypothetical protein